MSDAKLIGVGADNYFDKPGRSHWVDSYDVEMMEIFKKFTKRCRRYVCLEWFDIFKMFIKSGLIW